MLLPVIPPFAASLGADVTQVGFIIALQLYVTAVLVAPAGMLSDRLGRKNLYVIGIILNLLSFIAYLFSSNLGILIVARVLGGLASGGTYPASSTLVVDAVPPEKRGQALGTLTTCTQLGSMLGPAAGGVMLKNFGYETVFAVAAGLMTLALVISLTRLKTVRAMPAPAGSQQKSFRWMGDKRAMAGFLAIVMVMVGLASLNSFLPFYGSEIGLDIDRVGLIIATVYLGSVLMRALGGWLSDRAGRAPVMIAGLAMAATGIFLTSLFASEVPLHVAAIVFGLGMGLTLPASAALLADVAPFPMRGLAMGLYAAAFHSGQAIGATGLGLMEPRTGFHDMYLIAAIAMGAMVLGVFVLTRRRASG